MDGEVRETLQSGLIGVEKCMCNTIFERILGHPQEMEKHIDTI